MLRVDSATRISPAKAKALRHRFITMTHFPREADPDPYVMSSRVNMTMFPPQDSLVEIHSFVGLRSSEGSSADVDDGPAASADGTTTGNNTGPVTARPNQACGSDECTTCFVTVRTRRAMLKRKRGFFFMMATCCCSVDVKEWRGEWIPSNVWPSSKKVLTLTHLNKKIKLYIGVISLFLFFYDWLFCNHSKAPKQVSVSQCVQIDHNSITIVKRGIGCVGAYFVFFFTVLHLVI